MDKKILLLALENAIKYNGKASQGSIIGRLMSVDPSLGKDKDKMKELSKIIGETVKKVNAMKLEDQQKEFEQFGGEISKEKKEKKSSLPDLNNTNKVVMRFEPSPSGPLHIGHAYVLGLNYYYANKYNGKLILRIGDTNASNIYEPAYNLIPKDADWLTKSNIFELMIQSDRLDTYYEYALKFIDAGHCYVCSCPAEEFREISKKQEECSCRSLTSEENVKRWHYMFGKTEEGGAVLRFKTDMKHKNPAMRDFPLFRINDDPHPRTGKKYRVWPLMNFSVLVDDHESGMTHIIRAKDHADNAKRQEMMYKAMNWHVPQTLFVGRINFEDLEVSCSKTREKIENGEFEGWDDIKLPFLGSLKRRGFQPETFIKYATDVGMSLTDKTVSKKDFFKTLNHFNQELLENDSDRYFFIPNPIEIVVKNAPDQEIELDLHPDHRKGGRVLHCNDKYYLTNEDINLFKEKENIRLMDCLNFTIENKDEMKFKFHSVEFEHVKGNARIIHWLPAHDVIDVEVVMDDGTIVKGKGERLLEDLKEGDIVQFVRFGFCRLDHIEDGKLVFWFAH
jgi:glutamyl-tRNA synthetase